MHTSARSETVRDRLDWDVIHRRLERTRAALEQTSTASHEEKRSILRTRAKALAREPKKDEIGQAGIEVVEFVVACENYAIESSYVREVLPLKELTPLPGTPAFLLGVMNVRGRILSIIDPRQFFGLPEKGLTDLNKVIHISDSRMEFGLLADSVPGLRHIPLSKLQPSLPTLTGLRAELLRGVTPERLVVLDAARVLSDNRIIVHDKPET